MTKKPDSLLSKIIRRAPLYIIIGLVAALIWPIAQRQGSHLVSENLSPDGLYKADVYRYANPFTEDPEGGGGWVELIDAGGEIWDVLSLDEIKNLQVTWSSDSVVFGPDAAIPLPSPKELAVQAKERARKAADAKAKAEVEAQALARQKAEADARAKARAEYEAQQQ